MANPASKEPRNQGAPSGQSPAASEGDGAADDGVDLGQLWSTIRESHRFILAFGGIVFCLIMAHALSSPMTFRTTGRLYLGELEAKGRASGDIDISGGGQGDVGSEIEILKSKSLVSRGILDGGLNVSLTPEGWRPPRFWKWLASDRDTRILDVAPKEIAAVNTSLADNSRGSQRYSVRFVTDDEYEVWTDEKLLGRGRLGDTLTLDGLTVALIHGTERGPKAGARYTMVVHPLDVVTDQILEALTVAAPKAVGSESAKVVNLEFTDRSPYFAATFLRKLMRGYLDERQAWKTEDASAAESFVTDQLRSLRESLDNSEKKLADYRSTTRGTLEDEAKLMIAQAGKYEEQRVAARLQVAALSEVKRALKLPNPPTEAFLLGEANDTVLEGLSHSLADARQQLADAEEQFGPSSPQARQQHKQVEVQLQMIRSYVGNRLARAEENLAELNKVIGQYEEKLRTVPGAELGLAQLGRESEVYSRVYSYMLERQQQAAITKASTVSKNRILDFPQVPYREDAPKLLLRLASAPLALLLGAVLVLLHRMFASSLQSESEVRRVLGGVPIYANVPLRPRVKGERHLSDAHSIDVLARAQSAPFAEAFRTLRTNLYHWGTTGQARVVLFTSPTPGDGKTSCVLSLAAILAADKKRVLVVDADLRKPSHHDLTEQGQGPGLRGILSGQCHWIDVVHPVRLSLGVYDSIAAGRMAPAELLSSERMSRFLNDAKAHYDFILIDSPSFPLVSDPLVLATVADIVLSVFRLRNTPRKLAAEHVRGLAAKADVYGAIVNDVKSLGTNYPVRAGLLGRRRGSEPAAAPRRRRGRKLLGIAACIGLTGAAALLTRQHPGAQEVLRRVDEQLRLGSGGASGVQVTAETVDVPAASAPDHAPVQAMAEAPTAEEAKTEAEPEEGAAAEPPSTPAPAEEKAQAAAAVGDDGAPKPTAAAGAPVQSAPTEPKPAAPVTKAVASPRSAAPAKKPASNVVRPWAQLTQAERLELIQRANAARAAAAAQERAAAKPESPTQEPAVREVAPEASEPRVAEARQEPPVATAPSGSPADDRPSTPSAAPDAARAEAPQRAVPKPTEAPVRSDGAGNDAAVAEHTPGAPVQTAPVMPPLGGGAPSSSVARP